MFVSDLKYTFVCGQHLFFICLKNVVFTHIYERVLGAVLMDRFHCLMTLGFCTKYY